MIITLIGQVIDKRYHVTALLGEVYHANTVL